MVCMERSSQSATSAAPVQERGRMYEPRAARKPRHDGIVLRKGSCQAAWLPGQPASLGRRKPCILSRASGPRGLSLGKEGGGVPGLQGEEQKHGQRLEKESSWEVRDSCFCHLTEMLAVAALRQPLVAARGGCTWDRWQWCRSLQEHRDGWGLTRNEWDPEA